MLIACGGKNADERQSGAATGSATEHGKCPDDIEVTRRADAVFSEMTGYADKIAARIAAWSDCNIVVADMRELEPQSRSVNLISDNAKAWAAALDPMCRPRVDELFQSAARAHAFSQKAAAIDQMEAKLTHCKDELLHGAAASP